MQDLTWAIEDEQVLDHLVGRRVEVLRHGRPGEHAVARPEAKVQLSQKRIDLPAGQRIGRTEHNKQSKSHHHRRTRRPRGRIA